MKDDIHSEEWEKEGGGVFGEAGEADEEAEQEPVGEVGFGAGDELECEQGGSEPEGEEDSVGRHDEAAGGEDGGSGKEGKGPVASDMRGFNFNSLSKVLSDEKTEHGAE